MSGHIDFGDHRYAAGRGIRNHLADFLLRIVATVAVAGIRCADRFGGAFAPGSLLREQWIAVYLDAPSLIISQMPVQNIQFVEFQQVDEPLADRYRKEMAADVKVHSPITESWAILHSAEWHFRAKLPQRLTGIDKAPEIGSFHADAAPTDFEPVMFTRQLSVYDKADLRLVLPGYLRILLRDVVGYYVEKASCSSPTQTIGCRVYPPGGILQLENAIIYLRCGWIGDYRKFCLPVRTSGQHACTKHCCRDHTAENSRSCLHTDSGHRITCLFQKVFFVGDVSPRNRRNPGIALYLSDFRNISAYADRGSTGNRR